VVCNEVERICSNNFTNLFTPEEDVMRKEELIEKIAGRYKIDKKDVGLIIDDAIAELASPVLFPTPGEEVGFINDNNCKNNCKEGLVSRKAAR